MKGKITSSRIYTSYIVFLTVWIGTQLIAPLVAPNLEIGALLLSGGISAGLFLCFFLIHGKQKFIPAVLAAAVFLSWIYFTGLQKLFLFIKEYVSWIRGNEISSANSISFEWINIFLLGMIFLLFALLMERFFILKELTGFALLIYLLFCVINQRQMHKVTVCLVVLFIISGVTEFLQGREKNSGERFSVKNGKRVIVYLLPFLMLYFIGTMVLPARQDRFDWRGLKEWYSGIQKTMIMLNQKAEELWGGEGDFGLQFSGFSEKGRVGGALANKDSEIMELTLTQGRKMNIYLTGNIFDSFDGKEWKAKEENSENEHIIDSLETMYAINRYAPANMEDYLYTAKAEVHYTRLNTKYLFTPQKTQNVIPADGWKGSLKEAGGQWLFSKKQGYGTEYEVLFYQMNLGHLIFSEMMETESQYRYGESPQKDIVEEIQKFSYLDLPSGIISEKMLQKRLQKIKSQYTQTYGVSHEVRRFIEDITADSGSDYERCRAIEQTLLGKNGILFTYTTSPPELPEDRELLDYFLLESREGYCTYYATAFVIMVRELGLPARYVQGFCVADKGLGEEKVTVSSNMAHAWPEVYFEGVGWIPFEPTPGFGSGRYLAWKPKTPVFEGAAMTAVYQPEEAPVPLGSQEQEAQRALQEDSSRERTSDLWKTMALIVVVAVVAVSGLLMGVEYLLWKRRYKRYSPEEKMKEHIKRNLRILKFIGFGLEQGETIGELRQRILLADDKFSLDFIPVFEKVNYGDAKVSEEMIKAVRQEKNFLLNKIKKAGKWKYYRIRIRMLLAEGVGYER